VIAGKAIFMVQNAVYLFPEIDDRVVGLENRNQSAYNFLPLISNRVEEISTLEMNAGPEQIAALNPDLVIMKNHMADRFDAPLRTLEIPVVYLDLESPEVFFEDIKVLGEIFQDEQRALEITTFYRERLERIDAALEGVGEDQKPRVLMIEYSDKGGEYAFYVPPSSWIQTTLVDRAGGIPVWADVEVSTGWSVVSFEQIAAWNPDKIFVVDYSGAGEQVVADLKSDPLWEALLAVQTDQLYAFAYDFYSWDQPDTRWILGLEWLATRIHPDLTADLDILQEVDQFYTELYGLNSQQVQSEILPLVTGDIP
jgi:iron complex transport system substrate-binding protein